MNNKGEYLGKCNLSRCTTNKHADWYNHGSLSYYCEDCAKMLSEDPVNKADALQLFGHDLCTKGEYKTLNEIIEEDNSFKFTNQYIDMKTVSDFNIPIAQSNHYTYIRETPKQHNNDLCICNSGIKFKKCCKK